MNITSKSLRALRNLHHSYRSIPNPKLIMTLLVKNEEDMLEQNLLFHRSMGVDAFIITDNNSTDRTPDIIWKYRQKGWVVESISETSTDYNQKKWVNRMIELAITKHHANWIINADADEFWYLPGGIKPMLAKTRANILLCQVHNVYPQENIPWTAWDKTVRSVKNTQDFGLSPYSIFAPQGAKVMHRAYGYLQISMGNHKVKMLPMLKKTCPLVIMHYNVRNKKHFMEKMINGGRQLEQRKSKHGGRHWRYFYALYKEGKLEEEYKRVIGEELFQELAESGHICNDNPIPTLLKNIDQHLG